MKKMLLLSFALLATTFVFAQEPAKPAPKAMASPAAKAEGKIGDKSIVISYHQPAVKGRKIWGDLVPFDKVWRTGANNATTITLDKDVKVGGKTLAAGRYAIFSIPTATDWTIIFNKGADQWAQIYTLSSPIKRKFSKSQFYAEWVLMTEWQLFWKRTAICGQRYFLSRE